MDFQADQLRKADGSAISNTALVLIVADTTGNGFASLFDGGQLNVNGLLGGTDDRVVARFDMTEWENGAAQNPDSEFELSSVTNWSTNDPLAIFWFPELTLASTEIDTNNTYGLFAGPGSTGESWITPGESAFTQFLFYTQSGGTLGTGAFASALGNASNTVSAVPEPSVSMLAMAGAMFAVLGRRRRRNRHP